MLLRPWRQIPLPNIVGNIGDGETFVSSLKIRELHLAHLQGSRQGLIDCGAQIIAILGIFHFLLVNQIAHIKMDKGILIVIESKD